MPPNGRTTAVVLVSGGMDSLVTAAIAAGEYELAFLHCNYGQRTEAKELACFDRIADHYLVRRRLVVEAPHIGRMGGSSLTDLNLDVETANPDESTGPAARAGEAGEGGPAGPASLAGLAELARKARLAGQPRTGIPSTYVPFRNAQLLSVAVGWGETIGARKVFIGAVEEDSSGYPDCRQAFFDSFNEAIRLGTRPETAIEIVTPVIAMRKAEIVKTGLRLRAPFLLTWSCYTDNELACGRCASCALRLRAFRAAGAEDPIRYARPA